MIQKSNIFKLLAAALVCTTCSQSPEKATTSVADTTNSSSATEEVASDVVEPGQKYSPLQKQFLTGYYVGDFSASKLDDAKNPMYENRINISIDSINGEVIYGHSVVAGNIRPFKGSITITDGQYMVEAKEPGDNIYDGTFYFSVATQVDEITGTWLANDKNLAVAERKYNLSKMDFKYDPKLTIDMDDRSVEVYNTYSQADNEAEMITPDAWKINASVIELTKTDVENMYKRDLEIMRNLIYARHGYSFKNREMRSFFDSYVDWYIPVSVNVTAELTELEKKNIDLIKRYEKHASSYYDSFGR